MELKTLLTAIAFFSLFLVLIGFYLQAVFERKNWPLWVSRVGFFVLMIIVFAILVFEAIQVDITTIKI